MRASLALLLALILALPLVLGPCAAGAIALLGGEPEHTCACGMAKPGECGCPECAVLEHQREEAARAPVIRSSCGDDALALAPATPPSTLASVSWILPAPRELRARELPPASLRDQLARAPEPPPPRA